MTERYHYGYTDPMPGTRVATQKDPTMLSNIVYAVMICGLTAGLAVASWHLLAAFLIAS